jgi:hypothetical protein
LTLANNLVASDDPDLGARELLPLAIGRYRITSFQKPHL